MREMPDGAKVVVFHEFIHSGDLMAARLGLEGYRYARMYSGTRDKKKVLHQFQDDPECQVFLVNSQSGALALNLQVARYVIFYECPVSPIVRAQAEKRCHRAGQEETVFYVDLFMRGSIEERILGFIKEGKDLFELLLAGKFKAKSLFLK